MAWSPATKGLPSFRRTLLSALISSIASFSSGYISTAVRKIAAFWSAGMCRWTMLRDLALIHAESVPCWAGVNS